LGLVLSDGSYYGEAETVARQNQRPFSWHGTVVSGVGHSAQRIFTSDAAFAALAGFAERR
jgi:hypothetical protein